MRGAPKFLAAGGRDGGKNGTALLYVSAAIDDLVFVLVAPVRTPGRRAGTGARVWTEGAKRWPS